jgi:hypothetical protein
LHEAALEQNQESDVVETYALSSSYSTIMMKLLETAQRADAAQSNLRVAVYESIMALVQYHAKVSRCLSCL